MVWLISPVNLSISIGQDSLNRLTCENKRRPNAAMTKIVRNKVIIIATTLLILNRTKKFTTGWSMMAIMFAKTRGRIMPWAIYKIASKVNSPMIKMLAFAYKGNFNSLSVTAFQNSFIRYAHEGIRSFLRKICLNTDWPNDLMASEF